MKSCSNQRKSIALLAVGMLEPEPERRLQAHLQTCLKCHDYYEELLSLKDSLVNAEVRADIETTEPFHRKLVARLARETASSRMGLFVQLRRLNWNWRVATAAGACALILGILIFFPQKPEVHSSSPSAVAVAVAAPKAKTEPAPTILNYEMTANHSIEALDELLTRQGNKNPSPSPMYSASTRPADNGLE